MEEHRVNQLPVVDAAGILVGALNMHDLFRAKVIDDHRQRGADARARRLRLMAFDVDGVLSDGSLSGPTEGQIDIRLDNLDGGGLKMPAQAGITVAIITGRPAPAASSCGQRTSVSRISIRWLTTSSGR